MNPPKICESLIRKISTYKRIPKESSVSIGEVPWHSPSGSVQVVGKKDFPEIATERDEGLKMLVDLRKESGQHRVELESTIFWCWTTGGVEAISKQVQKNC